MKVDKTIRNLLQRQSETLMLSRTKCSYRDSVYEFEENTAEEVEAIRMNLIKQLDKKTFIGMLLDKLKNK